MPQQTITFRVFVCSTFTDMKEERKLLQMSVFPRLEKFCEENGTKFQAVDLRWGINEESQLNQKTLDICLNEIYRCQKISKKPNFLILLGDKYGWQPLPAKIPKKEMDAILSELDVKSNLIIKWFKEDSNALPAEFILQPREKEFKTNKEWEKVKSKIQKLLRSTVDKLEFSPAQRIKYFASATHQEIIAGALEKQDSCIKPEEHILALIRETDGLPDDQSAKGYIDLENGIPSSYCKKQLKKLKKELKHNLGSNYRPYPAIWEDNKPKILDPYEFKQRVFDFLKGIIQAQIRVFVKPDEIGHEKLLQEKFRNKLTEHFFGRDQILHNIQTYLQNPKEKSPLSIIGESGSGKSSVIARATELELAGKETFIVYRFIGISSNSSNIVSMLQSISDQIACMHDTTLKTIVGEGNEKSLHDITYMTKIFKKCLGLANADKPILLFLDALDQLSETDETKVLQWLPKELPDHVKLVVSILPNMKSLLSKSVVLHLPILSKKEAYNILTKWFQSINRTITSDQEKLILYKFRKTKLPIFLKLAFEEARYWHSYDKDIHLSSNIKGIINNFMSRIEQEHTREFVEHAISYMLCGLYQGLAENEILEILAFDEDFWENTFLSNMSHKDHNQELIDIKREIESSSEIETKRAMRIPIVLWSRLFLDLEPFLTERDADDVPIITFFHRQFIHALEERYKLIALN